MGKRSADTELTKDSIENGEGVGRQLEPVEEIKFRSKEEIIKSGKPIIRLRRTPPTEEEGHLSPVSLSPKVTATASPPTIEQEEKLAAPIIIQEKEGDVVVPQEKSVENKKEDAPSSPSSSNKEPTTTEEEKVSVPSDSSEKNEEGSPNSSPPPSIFGTLFSKPFTNPFAEAAKSGESNFTSSSQPSATTSTPTVPQLFGSSSIFSIPTSSSSTTTTTTTNLGATTSSSTTDDKGDDDESAISSIAASTPRPAHFPGEEEEIETFSESNAVLLKCVPVQPPTEPSSEGGDTTSPPPSKSTPQMKFKKQGEGILKLLAPRGVTTINNETTIASDGGASSDKENTTCKKRRLVLRQKGTWSILLNSPLWLSKKFELMPQMTSGYGVRFVGLDHAKVSPSSADGTSQQHPPLAAYCVKFDSDVKRKEFLSAVGHPID